MRRILVINGPNLNLLGMREPEIYGRLTLPELETQIRSWGAERGVDVVTFQSNHEGAIIDRLHQARDSSDGVIINPGAYTHYSYAIHDAIASIVIPVVEVHISNVKARETWRRTSVIAAACAASIYGRGVEGYRWAIDHLVARAAWPVETVKYGEDEENVGDLRIPDGKGPHPLAVVVHGGFWRDHWRRDQMDRFSVDLTTRGWATWNIEYRRVNGGGGWPLTFEDVADAFDSIAGLAPERGLDLDRIVAVGHSAGGHLAVWAAGRHRLPAGAPGAGPEVAVARAVSLAGAVSLGDSHRLGLGEDAVEDLLRRPPGDGDNRYAIADPVRHLPTGVPTVLVHGEDDTVVPLSVSTAYAAAAAAAGQEVEVVALPRIGHMELIDPGSAAWPAVIAALTPD